MTDRARPSQGPEYPVRSMLPYFLGVLPFFRSVLPCFRGVFPCFRDSVARFSGVCPICFDATGALTNGVRAGAAALAIVAVVVLAGFARFAWRLR